LERYRREQAGQAISRIDSKDAQFGVLRQRLRRPEKCQLCGSTKRIRFHYWDESEGILTGMWLCLFCHNIAHLKGRYEGTELKDYTIEEWYQRYFALKEVPVRIEINKLYKPRRKGTGIE